MLLRVKKVVKTGSEGRRLCRSSGFFYYYLYMHHIDMTDTNYQPNFYELIVRISIRSHFSVLPFVLL